MGILNWLRGRKRRRWTGPELQAHALEQAGMLPDLTIDRHGIARVGDTRITPAEAGAILGDAVAETLMQPRPEVVGITVEIYDRGKWQEPITVGIVSVESPRVSELPD
jgi:hypothetical protein